MEDLYSFVVLTDELAENHVLQDIVEQILKQTIECGFFIQEYSRRNFGGMWQGDDWPSENIDLMLSREGDCAAFLGRG
jgi:hypothetical protein